MSVEQNKALIRRLMEEDISRGDESVAEAIIHPDFVDHTNPPGMQHGLEGHKAVVRLFRSVFPDLEWRIDDLITEGIRSSPAPRCAAPIGARSSASRPPGRSSR